MYHPKIYKTVSHTYLKQLSLLEADQPHKGPLRLKALRYLACQVTKHACTIPALVLLNCLVRCSVSD